MDKQFDPNDPESYPQSFYVYVLPILNVAAGITSSGNVLQIESGSAFEWMQATFGATSGGDDITSSCQATVQAVDSSSNANIYSQPAYLRGVFGDGTLPFILPYTRMFAGNSSINFSITNNNAGTTSFYLQLIGRKIWGYTPNVNG
jgi:hypothetical protein